MKFRVIGYEIPEVAIYSLAPDLSQSRLVEMFTACTRKDVKDSILANFTNPKSFLRVVVATLAFGMGLYQCLRYYSLGDIQ